MARREENLIVVREYYEIRDTLKKNPFDSILFEKFISLSFDTQYFLLNECEQEYCDSNTIPDKTYFCFRHKQKRTRSRAINSNLFIFDPEQYKPLLHKLAERKLTELDPHFVTQVCYSMVISFASVVDINNPRDQQTPGNYFEKLSTFMLTNHFRIQPNQGRITVPVDNDYIQLTMDLLLDLGPDKTKLNIAMKNSTRERASEFWAHQRILDQAFGMGEYTGLFFGLSETKTNSVTLEVVEICVPDQWRAYQQYVATIEGFYYLDPPYKYLELNNKLPRMVVKEFGYFFSDWLS